MAKLLNPKLVAKLKDAFGTKEVIVEKQGQRGQFAMAVDSGSYRLVKKGSSTGEEYRLNCPFCSDTKRRLYINHLWGTRSATTKRLTLWLAHCFNEECLTDFGNRKELYDMVFGDAEVPVDVTLLSNEEVEDPVQTPIDFPGLVRPLSHILRYSKDHKLIEWCLGRGYDPEYLATYYDVHYLELGRSVSSDLADRLLAPIYATFDGEVRLAAWTARRLDDSADGPKWKHSYGTIGNFFYGIDHAQDYETIVITEGPGDAWGVGLNAVAVLGKTLQQRKCEILKNVISSRPKGTRSSVVLLLDPMQDEKSKAKRLEHHMVKAHKTLQPYLSCPVLPVYLPEFSDPGSLDRDFIWACIYKTARKAGVYVSRKRVAA